MYKSLMFEIKNNKNYRKRKVSKFMKKTLPTCWKQRCYAFRGQSDHFNIDQTISSHCKSVKVTLISLIKPCYLSAKVELYSSPFWAQLYGNMALSTLHGRHSGNWEIGRFIYIDYAAILAVGLLIGLALVC